MKSLNLIGRIGLVLAGALMVWGLQGCGTGGAESGDEGGAAAPSGTEAGEFPGVSEAQQAQLKLGQSWYEVTCLACHQADGQGQEGFAPPFDPEWLARPKPHLIRMVLQGLRGPIQVGDRVYELEMPALGVLNDEQVAAALSYVRWRWGKAGSWAVAPAEVEAVRAATEARLDPWTVKDLDELGE